MSELRRDPLTGRWVILAPSRATRPHDRRGSTTAEAGEVDVACAFCPGQEAQTPPEVARRGGGEPDRPGWEVRVVPNRYPIVDGAAGPAEVSPDDLRQGQAAGGVHEVVVLSPAHDRSFARLDDDDALEVLRVLQDRARVHAGAGHVYTQVLVNHGAEAGASLTHPHAQIVAIDLAPPAVEEEVRHLAAGDRCVLCRELRRQDDDPALVVAGREAVLWCPWWSSTAYELLLAPREHVRRFEEADRELEAVAATLRHGLAVLDRHLGDPPYNLFFHSLPADRAEDYHWHIHIRPVLQVTAGFELGTGIGVNTLDPARAAEQLRGVGDSSVVP